MSSNDNGQIEMENKSTQLTDLVDMEKPQSIWEEVKAIMLMMHPEFHFEHLESAYKDVVKLFSGEYQGYQKCNTEYHDLRHAMAVVLATARLIHGVCIEKEHFTEKGINIGLIGALMHDTGYIQTTDDSKGTGGKYTLVHVERSIEFTKKYFSRNTYFKNDIASFRDVLNCTGLNINVSEIPFVSREMELIGKILGTADLFGQMGDRLYLEKLLFLYYEFAEAYNGCFDSELDLLQKTLDFYDFIKARFINQLGNVNNYMASHFQERWNIDSDLYTVGIENNINYLNYILKRHVSDYNKYLRRGSTLKTLEQ